MVDWYELVVGQWDSDIFVVVEYVYFGFCYSEYYYDGVDVVWKFKKDDYNSQYIVMRSNLEEINIDF